jgi:DNA-binding NtrC family response regulator
MDGVADVRDATREAGADIAPDRVDADIMAGEWNWSGPANTEMAANTPALRVLVVDDEPLIRWSLAQTLEDGGDAVTEAESGEMAVHALTNAFPPPDVVLLDYRLPDSSDLGLLTTVRRLVPRSQVILMTAHCTPEVMSDALRLGAYRVIMKPFDLQTVAAFVHQAHASRPH